MQKAFEWIDRDLLLYRLLLYNFDGKMYKAIKKNVYTNSTASVRLNGNMTDWFSVNSGVRQGDSLSTTLFNIYLNDLAAKIKESNLASCRM